MMTIGHMRYFPLILHHRPRSGDCNVITTYHYPYRVLTYTLSPYTVNATDLGKPPDIQISNAVITNKKRGSGYLPEEDSRKIRTVEKAPNKLAGITATVQPVY
ncbi:hypothetical protein SAMN05216402_2462 [Nitrosospira multiformis]|uniref:Uncharacterized protein n=1 Tax=Nitrosospira multiformis TaxID=1231 RepID=A0ABY0TMB0_9PROT|nr:hypothetical protein SAMN05216402_2462 [Nitrosospira multiformis]